MRTNIVNISKNGLIIASFFTAFNAYSQSDLISSDDKFGGITSLMSATADHDFEGVKFFSKNNPAIINQKNLGGATALHIASRVSDFDIAKVLVEKGASVNLTDNEGWTPLMRAALSKNKDIVNLLLMNGASAAKTNSFGESAIVHAAFSDCNECLFLILDRMNHFSDKEVLRQQINDAFIVARNHDNKDAQLILENALDRLDKGLTTGTANPEESQVVPVVSLNDQNSSAIVEENMPLITNFNGKKFSFKQGEGVKKPTFSDSIVAEKSLSAESVDEKTFVFTKNAEQKTSPELEKNVQTILQDAESKKTQQINASASEITAPVQQEETKQVQTQTQVVKPAKKFVFSKGVSFDDKNVDNQSAVKSTLETVSPVSKEEVENKVPSVASVEVITLEEKSEKKKGFFDWLMFWKSEDESEDFEVVEKDIAIEKIENITPKETVAQQPKFKFNSEKNR